MICQCQFQIAIALIEIFKGRIIHVICIFGLHFWLVGNKQIFDIDTYINHIVFYCWLTQIILILFHKKIMRTYKKFRNNIGQQKKFRDRGSQNIKCVLNFFCQFFRKYWFYPIKLFWDTLYQFTNFCKEE